MKKVGLFLVILLVLLQSCANPIAPTGGIKDEQPPRVDSTASTPNLQVNFTDRFFELTFDEWVVLEDLRNQVIVSPPLDYDITLKKKTVRFELKETDTLRSNTTYTINFGDAVQDLTEKNPAEDLRFVFSTGPFLDSLNMQGMVFDVKTRKPLEDVYFFLYDNLADSVVRTQRPYYFGKTNEQGLFSIKNIKPGTFKGFALKDNDFNYLFNAVSEAIGFPDSLIQIQVGPEPVISIQLFQESPPLRLVNTETGRYGEIAMLFNQTPPASIQIELADSLALDTLREVIGDTLKLWYTTPAPVNWSMIITQDTVLRDTIQVRTPDINEFRSQGRLKLVKPSANGTSTLKPGASAELVWNFPLASVDTAGIRIRQDTLPDLIPQIRIDSQNTRNLILDFAGQQDSAYQLFIPPGNITDGFDFQNDSTLLDYKIGNLEDFGNIIIELTDLDSTQNYRIDVLNGSTEVATFYAEQVATFNFRKDIIRPGKYQIRITEDRNRNGVWDTGNYNLKRQAEAIYTRDLDQLRANWDLEVSISLPDLYPIVVEE